MVIRNLGSSRDSKHLASVHQQGHQTEEEIVPRNEYWCWYSLCRIRSSHIWTTESTAICLASGNRNQRHEPLHDCCMRNMRTYNNK